MNLHQLPTLNACLNTIASIFLIMGWRAIKAGNSKLHKTCMTAALIASTLFLCSYVTYHFNVGRTYYQGEGVLRIIYFFILLTHTPLAVIIVPFCITAVIHAIKGNFEKHKRITTWLAPVWLYVSVTGVIIYAMLYLF
jgi:putative membrane protein